MKKPQAEINPAAQILADQFETIAIRASKIEKTFISAILKYNKSTDKHTPLDEVSELQMLTSSLLVNIITVEELTARLTINHLTDEEIDRYHSAILKCYALIMYVGKTIAHMGVTQYMMDPFWPSYNVKLLNYYGRFAKTIHTQKNHEVYIGISIQMILRKIIREETYLSVPNEKVRLLRTYNLLCNFITQIHNPFLKLQGRLIRFEVEQDESVTRYLPYDFDLPKDHYFRLTMEGVKTITDPDIKWYKHFARCLLLTGELKAINKKIKAYKNKTVPQGKADCIINIRKRSALHQELTRLFQQCQFDILVQEIAESVETASVNIQYYKILQTHEMLIILLERASDCLNISIEILDQNIDSTETNIWQIHYGCLVLKRKWLEYSKQITTLHNKISNETRSVVDLEKKLEDVQNQLKKMDKEVEEREKESTKLTGETNNTKIKKFTKRKTWLHNWLLSHKESTSNTYEKACERADHLLTENKIDEAIACYQELAQRTDIDSCQRSMIYITLGEIYQKDSPEKAAAQYHVAEEYVTRLLANATNDEKHVLQMHLDMAREHLSNMNSEASSYASTESDDDTFNWEHEIISGEMPLPAIIEHIDQLLQTAGISLFIVGGYISGYLLNSLKYNDVDAVALQHDATNDKSNLLLRIQALLQPHYPFCEIRSREHPILYIQHEKTIVEISGINVPAEAYKQNTLGYDQICSLLRKNAEPRDTTDNALYYDIRKGHIIDFFGGVKEILSFSLNPIKSPNETFANDPTLFFRSLRSIVRRLQQQSDLVAFSSQFLDAMRQHGNRIKRMTSSQFEKEMLKTFFRGHALATWKFLIKHELQHILFPLPQDDDNHFRHLIMIERTLSNLDNRIKKEKKYTLCFTYSVILWGIFSEKLEHIKQTQPLTEAVAKELCHDVFSNKDQSLGIPFSETMRDDISKIWLAYLHGQNMIKVKTLKFEYGHGVLSEVLHNTIRNNMMFVPKTKLTSAAGKQGFFYHAKMELIIKELIHNNKLQYSYDNKVTSLSFSSNTIISEVDRKLLLEHLKRNFKIVLGKHRIDYAIVAADAIMITTDYIDIKRAIDQLMEFIFDWSHNEVGINKTYQALI